jgi:hypothetical protein
MENKNNMETQVIIEATEYALIYNKKVEKVSFYIHNNCVVISGLDKKDNVVQGLQLEVGSSDFLKLSKLMLSLNQ